jgi:flavodoxin
VIHQIYEKNGYQVRLLCKLGYIKVMILRLDKYIAEQEETKVSTPKKLNIKWEKPDLAEEIEHYNNKAKLEFYQHNIDIPNSDIKKVAAKATKFYKYIFQPFTKGKMMDLPIVSEDEFQVTKIQNFDSYEYENIVAGAYGRGYGDVLVEVTDQLKENGTISLPAPIVIRFINFGETRRSGESSYFLLSGNRRANLALHYGIPVKVWVVDLIPSRRDVRDFAEKSGILRKGEDNFKEYIQKTVGKENIDDLTARERFNLIQTLKKYGK